MCGRTGARSAFSVAGKGLTWVLFVCEHRPGIICGESLPRHSRRGLDKLRQVLVALGLFHHTKSDCYTLYVGNDLPPRLSWSCIAVSSFLPLCFSATSSLSCVSLSASLTRSATFDVAATLSPTRDPPRRFRDNGDRPTCAAKASPEERDLDTRILQGCRRQGIMGTPDMLKPRAHGPANTCSILSASSAI